MRDRSYARSRAHLDVALFAEVVRRVDHEVASVAHAAFDVIGKSAGPIRNMGAFFEDKDFDVWVETARPRRGAESRGHASDDHELHVRLFLLPHLLHETENVESLDLTVG